MTEENEVKINVLALIEREIQDVEIGARWELDVLRVVEKREESLAKCWRSLLELNDPFDEQDPLIVELKRAEEECRQMFADIEAKCYVLWERRRPHVEAGWLLWRRVVIPKAEETPAVVDLFKRFISDDYRLGKGDDEGYIFRAISERGFGPCGIYERRVGQRTPIASLPPLMHTVTDVQPEWEETQRGEDICVRDYSENG